MVGAADAWVLSVDQFRILWESQVGHAPFPDGFSYGSRSRADGADAKRAADSATAARLAATNSPMKTRAFASLCRPTLSVGVTGAIPGPGGRPRPLRVHSGWRDGEELAFVAIEEPRADGATDGDLSVTITGHPRSQWTSALVAVLPTCDGAGRLPSDPDVPTTTVRLFETSVPVVAPSASRTSAAAAFVHLQPAMGAVFTVSVGSLADGLTPTSMDVHIADIGGDGRYALILDRPTVAAGVDTPALARIVDNVLNGLRVRHDARIADL